MSKSEIIGNQGLKFIAHNYCRWISKGAADKIFDVISLNELTGKSEAIKGKVQTPCRNMDFIYFLRRGGRVAEGGGLLNR